MFTLRIWFIALAILSTVSSFSSLCFAAANPLPQTEIVSSENSGWIRLGNKRLAARPNEDGKVPILEYHNITTSEKLGPYEYAASSFRSDLEWLYVHNYRPISLSDYVRGWINIPAGTSPVVLTFDDSLTGQFSCIANNVVDPNCAVGILDAFHTEHPDWALKATFFVLTNEDPRLPAPFADPGVLGDPSQSRYASFKMRYLVGKGYEIGNHTLHHSLKLRSMTEDQVEQEFVGGVLGIHCYLPNYRVQTLALPYGIYPIDRALVIQGSNSMGSYHNICALEAGSQPALSPVSLSFKPYEIPRIIPRNAAVQPGGRLTIRYWLNQLELFPNEKYISDGDPETFTVPFNRATDLDFNRLKFLHYKIRLYRPGKIVEYQ